MNTVQWCPVDIDNIFVFDGNTYKIPKDNQNYKVYNTPSKDKYGNWNDWENRSEMDQVLAVKIKDKYYFFDENLNQIKVKGSVV